MAHRLPELPFAKDALAPHISQETLEYHHGKHHAAYVNNLNNLLTGSGLEDKPLAELIVDLSGVAADKRTGVFNNAAQVWNHTFYWSCLSPRGAGPDDATAAKLAAAFGSVDAFRQQFTQKAQTQFGSGWAWLVKNRDGSLALTQTSNAGCPLTEGQTPILTCDVWEHAYYVDYRNARPAYIEAFWKIVNWDFVAKNLG